MEQKNETGIKSERSLHCLLSLPDSLNFTSPFRPKLLISLRKQWWERTLPSAPDSSHFLYQCCWHLNLTFPMRTAGRAISFVGMMIKWGYAVQVSGKDYTDRSIKKTDGCSVAWWHVRPIWCHPHHIAKISRCLILSHYSRMQTPKTTLTNPTSCEVLGMQGDGDSCRCLWKLQGDWQAGGWKQ